MVFRPRAFSRSSSPEKYSSPAAPGTTLRMSRVA
jgi:hypothetical protein